MYRAFIILAAVCLCACARSSLRPGGSTSSGSGGSSTTTTTSSATSTGSGGFGGIGGSGGVFCPWLEQSGPPIGIVPEPGWHQQRPQLVRSRQDGQLVTLAFERVPVESPGPVPTEVRHASFEPWEVWPSTAIGPSYLATTEGGWSYAAAESTGDHFALLYTQGLPQASHGVSFSELFTPGADGSGSQIEIEPAAVRSLFAAYSGAAEHFVGVQQPGPYQGFPPDPNASHELAVAWVESPPNPYFVRGPFAVGCVDSPVVAHAIRSDTIWLLARAMRYAGCLDDVPPGPATELNVSFFDSDDVQYFGVSFPGATAVQWLRLVPRSVGSWLVWRRQLDQPIEAARLDPSGQLAAGPFTLTDASNQPQWIAADRFGDALAVTWIDTIVNGPPLLVVAIYDDEGQQVAKADLWPDNWASDLPTILGSPDGDALLVAWTEQLGDDAGDVVKMARFVCGLP